MRDSIEEGLTQIAGSMQYPQTPSLSRLVLARIQGSSSTGSRMRKMAFASAVILVLLSTLMLVPPVRAAILEFIQIGIVRIFNTNTDERISFETPISPGPESNGHVTTMPGGQDEIFTFLGELSGEATLEQAQELVDYPILLPDYPAELGDPDRVFVQEAEGRMLVLIWLSDLQPDHVALSLHFIPEGSWAVEKFKPEVIQETSVNGARAVWTEGPYPLILRNGQVEIVRLIAGHVLNWTADGITIRLETDLPLEGAIRIAESLQPYVIDAPAR